MQTKTHFSLQLRLPLEIEEAIIDNFARGLLRGFLLELRLVSREWMARIDFHIFRKIAISVDEFPELLVLLHESFHGIGRRILQLTVSTSQSSRLAEAFNTEKDTQTTPTPSSSNRGPVPSLDFSIDLPSCLPHVETLSLIGLTPSELEKIPSLPSVKHLYIRDSLIKTSHLWNIISTARVLETIRHEKMLLDINTHMGNRDNKLTLQIKPKEREHTSRDARKWTSLTEYSTDLSKCYIPSLSLDGFLFPEGVVTPVLRCLCFKNILVTSLPIVNRLMRASCRTLQTLEISFERHGEMSSEVRLRESLDLSQCVRLEQVTIDALKHDSTMSRRHGLESTAIILQSLPNISKCTASESGGSSETSSTKETDETNGFSIIKASNTIKVSLRFPYDWRGGYEAIDSIDQTLATNPLVMNVDIIVWHPDKNRELISNDFPRLHSKSILNVCKDQRWQSSIRNRALW